MKAYKIILTLIILAILQWSCEKEFLEKSPLVGTTEGNFYKTEGDAIAAVNAAYASLQYELTPAAHFRWFWGDIMSDDSEKGGSGDNDGVELLQLETFLGPTNTDMLESEWAADFEGIYRANVALEKVPDIEMDEDLKRRLLAEAKFVRAYFYYNLVTIFGGVPLADRVLAPSEYDISRASADEIWTLIESDLKDAAADLFLRSEYAAGDLGRATKGAAQGLLLKSYVYQNRWVEAQAIAEEIVNSGEYQLETNYANIFTEGGENGSGSVFEIQYMNASGGNWGRNAQNEGTFSNVFQRARGQFEGFGFNIPTQDLVDAFFAEGFEDPRLNSTVFREGEPMGDRGVFTKDATGGFPHDYYQKKYFNNKSEEAPFGDPNPNGGSNDRIIRYADVLLLHAEAAFYNGDESTAKTSLNRVRERARGTNADVLPDVTSSGTALLDAIYHERRVELALEGHRFFDLVRSGRAQEVLGPLGYQEATHRLFPIPETQIQATNGALVQNPGY